MRAEEYLKQLKCCVSCVCDYVHVGGVCMQVLQAMAPDEKMSGSIPLDVIESLVVAAVESVARSVTSQRSAVRH